MEEKELCIRIGRNIKKLREEAGVSQQELAFRCGFETSNMCRIEAGKTNPTIITLYKISKALQVGLGKVVE
ncbi:MAG: helix-turn-helix transcriptional regulator [Paludibacteraceae bacterium]|jgi:transcriptional regulator with XRE-family HTH domain|nr:helix-turn-helix transcriptional regulator [Paludibacteraceae bacterium]